MPPYNRVRGLDLTAEQQRDLVEYLKSLRMTPSRRRGGRTFDAWRRFALGYLWEVNAEQLLVRPADSRPMEGLAEWQLANGEWIRFSMIRRPTCRRKALSLAVRPLQTP